MAEKLYKCLTKVTGKHKVYNKNDIMPESEIFGNKEIQIDGQKEVKDGSNKIKIQAKRPVLKAYVEPKGSK